MVVRARIDNPLVVLKLVSTPDAFCANTTSTQNISKAQLRSHLQHIGPVRQTTALILSVAKFALSNTLGKQVNSEKKSITTVPL